MSELTKCNCTACEAARGCGFPSRIKLDQSADPTIHPFANMKLPGNNTIGQMILEITKPLLHRIELLENRVKELEDNG